MKDFESSTLWRISAFERVRESEPTVPSTMLSSTLSAELSQLQRQPATDDVLEVTAACLRHQEPALLYLAHGVHVWPVTLFPRQWLYHAPYEASSLGPEAQLSRLKLLAAERPGVRPPGHWMFERVAATERYRPLRPLLWTLALHGPRRTVLAEIGGRAAYRVTSGGVGDRPTLPGATGLAMQWLRQDAASLHDMQQWPGMSLERACRLLNGLYLTGGLMVTRSHPSAREEPAPARAPRRH